MESARARYESFGFTLTPRGRHIGWATANYCIMFAADYIELLGILEPGAYSAGLDSTLAERGEGILKLALSSADADATHAFLAAKGLVSAPVADLARELEIPGNTVLPRFRLVHPAPPALPGLPGFICQHLTPDLLRQETWCVHRNTATGVASYLVVADEPAVLRDGWARLLGPAATKLDRSRLVVETARARLEFVASDALARDFAGIDGGFLKSGMIAGMRIAVADMAAAEFCLAEAGVALLHRAGQLIVPPQHACGAILVFEQTPRGGAGSGRP
ncbi:MAG: VOC family protein [Rhodospirillales bacterium]|nr:MAG: VOC family protein [Rhodospirillales bacterium]